VLIRRVFIHFVTKMSGHFLEEQISIKFCVKLGKNRSDNCAVLSKAYGGKTMKKSECLQGCGRC
jgi:hypothetical protein